MNSQYDGGITKILNENRGPKVLYLVHLSYL